MELNTLIRGPRLRSKHIKRGAPLKAVREQAASSALHRTLLKSLPLCLLSYARTSADIADLYCRTTRCTLSSQLASVGPFQPFSTPAKRQTHRPSPWLRACRTAFSGLTIHAPFRRGRRRSWARRPWRAERAPPSTTATPWPRRLQLPWQPAAWSASRVRALGRWRRRRGSRRRWLHRQPRTSGRQRRRRRLAPSTLFAQRRRPATTCAHFRPAPLKAPKGSGSRLEALSRPAPRSLPWARPPAARAGGRSGGPRRRRRGTVASFAWRTCSLASVPASTAPRHAPCSHCGCPHPCHCPVRGLWSVSCLKTRLCGGCRALRPGLASTALRTRRRRRRAAQP